LRESRAIPPKLETPGIAKVALILAKSAKDAKEIQKLKMFARAVSRERLFCPVGYCECPRNFMKAARTAALAKKGRRWKRDTIAGG
jgi:hypothetical protein